MALPSAIKQSRIDSSELDGEPPIDPANPNSFPATGWPEPVLGMISPDSLSLSAQVSGSASGQFEISNIGTAPLDYTIGSDQDWLQVSPANGSIAASQSQTPGISASCGTTPETRAGTLGITSNGGNASVPVTLICDAEPVGIIGNITPVSLSLEAVLSGTATSSFRFTNAGNATLDFRAFGIGESSEWLTVMPFSGSLDAGATQVQGVQGECFDSDAYTISTSVQIINDSTNASELLPLTLRCIEAELTLVSSLSGQNEVPPVVTTAAGIGLVNVDLVGGDIVVDLSVFGLTPVAAHIHRGVTGTNGEVVVGLIQSVDIEGFWFAPPGTVFSPSDFTELRSGSMYFNVHTDQFPAGEIRGQIVAE